MWNAIEVEYQPVYQQGYDEGVTGQFEPDDNPFQDRVERFYWSEGFFDGYKQYLSAERSVNEESQA